MAARLPSELLVAALLRRVQAAGGFATVLAKGDAGSGSILLILRAPGEPPRAVERAPDLDGGYRLTPTGPTDGDEAALDSYWRRRRERDPDLWVVELDIPDGERFAAETILMN